MFIKKKGCVCDKGVQVRERGNKCQRDRVILWEDKWVFDENSLKNSEQGGLGTEEGVEEDKKRYVFKR